MAPEAKAPGAVPSENKMERYQDYGDLWVQTFTGTGVGGVMMLQTPRAEDFDIIGAAHHCAITNRYIGALRLPLSIAQHSVEIADRLPKHLQAHGLFHDASHEPYVNDISTPFKAVIERRAGSPIISEIENRLEAATFQALCLGHLPKAERDIIKREDLRALMTERRDLGEKAPMPWVVDSFGAEPWPETLDAWPWWYAERKFLDRTLKYLPFSFSNEDRERIHERIHDLHTIGINECSRARMYL